MSADSIACVILAGGRGTRLASTGVGETDKALLVLGERPLIAHVRERLPLPDARIAISANGDPTRFARFGLPVLADAQGDRPGPLAGILAGLEWAARLTPAPRWLLSVPTDTPFLPQNLVPQLLGAAAVLPDRITIAATADGLQHAVALWPLSAAAPLVTALARGEHRVLAAADAVGLVAVPFLERGPGGIDPFFNVNTPADRASALRVLSGGRAATPVLGIAGWKNSGKTTLTERLVAHFAASGADVATVKHAHHGFDIDHPGTDSDRHRRAGARSVTIVSAVRLARIEELHGTPEPSLDAILRRAPAADLILVEGFKHASIPKLEVRRSAGHAGPPLAGHDPWIKAIAADYALTDPVLPVFALDDPAAIARWIRTQFPGL